MFKRILEHFLCNRCIKKIKYCCGFQYKLLSSKLILTCLGRLSALGICTDRRRKMEEKIPLAPMGVLATGSAHARPSAWPHIDTSGNFSAHMSGGGELSESYSDQLSRQIREF